MSVKISCVCVTHARAHVMGETVESYLRQQPCGVETELLIVNDCNEQPLSCAAPGVRVVNIPHCRTVFDKFDAAVALAAGEYIAWWEDDDISLPHRLARSVAMSGGLVNNYKQGNAWHMVDDTIRGQGPNFFFGNSIWRKADYRGAQGSGVGIEGYPDHNAHMGIMASVYARGGYYTMEEAAPADIFFIYRRQTGVVPDSSFGPDWSDPVARAIHWHKLQIARPEFQPGPQIIVPNWRADYTALAEEASCK